jgi:hypothetical protein
MNGGIDPRLLTSTLDRSEWSAPAALVLGKHLEVPVVYEARSAAQPVRTLWIGEEILTRAGNLTLAMKPVALRSQLQRGKKENIILIAQKLSWNEGHLA